MNASPGCSRSAEDEVSLRATSYAWVCPQCGGDNAGQPLARRVACQKCGRSFPTQGTRDEFPVNSSACPPTARAIEIQAGLAIYHAAQARWPCVPPDRIFLTATTVLFSPPRSRRSTTVWAARVIEVWEEEPAEGEYGPHYLGITWGSPCRCRQTRLHGPYERERAAQELRQRVAEKKERGYHDEWSRLLD